MSEKKEVLPLKTMTIKELSGHGHLKDSDLKAHLKQLAGTEGQELCAVAGEINGHGSKITPFGPSVYFTGSFVGVNRRTGQQFRSGKFYPSKDFADVLIAQFASAGVSSGLRFNVVISVVPSTKGADGYTYVSEPIRTAEVIDRQADLFATLGQMPKLIDNKKKA